MFADLAEGEAVEVNAEDALQEYMSQNERDEIARQRDYMEHGAGKIESILNGEMSKLYSKMDEQIRAQDDDFM